VAVGQRDQMSFEKKMISIFGDFSQFSAKKLAFFSKYQRYDQIFA
jgi:hypothetical protein